MVVLIVFHDNASLRHGMGMALRVSGPFDRTGFDLLDGRKTVDMEGDICSVCLSVEMTKVHSAAKALKLKHRWVKWRLGTVFGRVRRQLPHTVLNQTNK